MTDLVERHEPETGPRVDGQPPTGTPQPPPPEPPPPPPTLQPQPATPPSTPKRRQAFSRRQVIVALVAIVAILAGATVAVVLVNHHTAPAPVAARAIKPSTPQSQPPLTVPEVILQRDTNSEGTVDFDGALGLSPTSSPHFRESRCPRALPTIPEGTPTSL